MLQSRSISVIHNQFRVCCASKTYNISDPMSYVYSVQRCKKIGFHESILDTITTNDEALLSIKHTGDTVAIDSNDLDALKVPTRRPSYCPFAGRNQALRTHIPPAKTPPDRIHIPVASACLVESPCRNALLLTQRPSHMRTYPGLWVPPGGHSEPGEPIGTTALRELCEELGFASDVLNRWTTELVKTMQPLCAWEAAYPAAEAPRSHHLVLYYVVRWPSWLLSHVGSSPVRDDSSSELPLPLLYPPPDEVQSVIWLPRSVLSALSKDWLEFDSFWGEMLQALTMGQTHAHIRTPDGNLVNRLDTDVWCLNSQQCQWERKPVNQLIHSVASPASCDPGQLVAPELTGTTSNSVSVGTLYAITQWLSMHDSD